MTGRGLNAKTTYLIQTEVLKSGFPETRIVYNARRRYTEFRTLYDEFRKLSNSEFKTPFPPKSFKSKSSSSYWLTIIIMIL